MTTVGFCNIKQGDVAYVLADSFEVTCVSEFVNFKHRGQPSSSMAAPNLHEQLFAAIDGKCKDIMADLCRRDLRNGLVQLKMNLLICQHAIEQFFVNEELKGKVKLLVEQNDQLKLDVAENKKDLKQIKDALAKAFTAMPDEGTQQSASVPASQEQGQAPSDPLPVKRFKSEE